LIKSSKDGEQAILVQVFLSTEEESAEDLEELQELVVSAGANPIASVTTANTIPNAKYFIGQGKLEEIKTHVDALEADVVIFNHELTPSQERNLERFLACRVLDRTALILDIFAQRARTFEGKLQVELAQLEHLSTRLIRGWTHLERQKGGIGLRGPGETQLETDRRLIRNRIKIIKSRLAKVKKQRVQLRQRRTRLALPTISLVGYTNAGKSTLFNRLTEATVYVADQLFATLDSTSRSIEVPGIGVAIMSDTVGFIRHLPHQLIEAFHATLEETQEANLLLHVIDAHDDARDINIEAVNQVLDEIHVANVPQLQVLNKIDLLENIESRIDRDDEGRPVRVWISALSGKGLSLLQTAIQECLSEETVHCCIRLTPRQSSLRSILYDRQAIVSEQSADNGDYLIEIRMPYKKFTQLSFT